MYEAVPDLELSSQLLKTVSGFRIELVFVGFLLEFFLSMTPKVLIFFIFDSDIANKGFHQGNCSTFSLQNKEIFIFHLDFIHFTFKSVLNQLVIGNFKYFKMKKDFFEEFSCLPLQ